MMKDMEEADLLELVSQHHENGVQQLDDLKFIGEKTKFSF